MLLVLGRGPLAATRQRLEGAAGGAAAGRCYNSVSPRLAVAARDGNDNAAMAGGGATVS